MLKHSHLTCSKVSSLAFGAACLLLAWPVQSAVYRSVDANGNVVYTDNPTSAYNHSQDSQKITLMDALSSENRANVLNQPVSTPNTLPEVRGQTSTSSASPRISQRGDYQLSIQSPVVDMVYRRPAQSIDIVVNVSPDLKAGDRLIYRINGKHVATTQDTQYQISTMDFLPERYTLTVELQNVKGDVLVSDSRAFYVLQNNTIIRKKRQAAAQQAAYDRLPWYQKMLVRRSAYR